MLFNDNDYGSDDDTPIKKLEKMIRDFILESFVGRILIEAGRMFLMVFIGYMLMCSFGNFLVYLLKFGKMILKNIS